jgi:spore germination cell wall hydrolase CwlJ-like protein
VAPAAAEEFEIKPAVLTPALAALRQQPSGTEVRLTTSVLNNYIARQNALKAFDGFGVNPDPELTEEALLGYIARQQNPALAAIDQLDLPKPDLNDGVMENYVARGFMPTSKRVKLATSERECLAQAIYHEARGETEAGQWAVANIIINRAFSGKYPPTLCGVVYQNAEKGRYKCQFTFACDGRSDVARDQGSWRRSLRIAEGAFYEFQRGDRPDVLPANALFYHTRQVAPNWSHTYKRVAAIGSHVFYAVR